MTLRASTGMSPFVGTFTFTNLPSASDYSGMEAFASDWGANGTKVRSNGTRWLPVNGQTVLKRMGAAVSGIAGTETIATQVQLPLGALQTGDLIFVRASVSKSGSTDTLLASLRLGTAGTTADTAILGYSAATALAAANMAAGLFYGFRILGATTARKTGSAATSNSYAGATNAGIASTTTVSDVSANAMWVSFTIKSGGVTDTVGAEEITITHEAG